MRWIKIRIDRGEMNALYIHRINQDGRQYNWNDNKMQCSAYNVGWHIIPFNHVAQKHAGDLASNRMIPTFMTAISLQNNVDILRYPQINIHWNVFYVDHDPVKLWRFHHTTAITYISVECKQFVNMRFYVCFYCKITLHRINNVF